MAEFKSHRENENRIHQQLYGNMFLLSQFYPTSKDFNAVLKKDMFVKSNKAAFLEVVHYLLNILNPEQAKEKLTSWPPYDIKRENKFRTEVLKYINELNVLYDNANIPHIMASHLISPGGLKFTKFMLKLSQLVMFEHLKSTEEVDILYCPKPSKNINFTKANLNNLKKKTSLIENETRNAIKDFESLRFNSNEKALAIDEELKSLNDKIRSAKKDFEVVKEEFHKTYPNYPSLEILEEKINSIKCQYEGFQEIYKVFSECDNLVTYLNSNDLVLEHNKENLKLPNEVLHIVKNQGELDLTDFFQGLHILLEKKALEFPYPTNSYISESTEKVKELCVQYNEINNNFMENAKDIQTVLEKISLSIKSLAEVESTSETEEVLAVPLSDSVTSK